MVWKPSEKEEEYFTRMGFERKKKLEEEKHRKLKEEDKKRLKGLHYMRCAKCGMELIVMARNRKTFMERNGTNEMVSA